MKLRSGRNKYSPVSRKLELFEAKINKTDSCWLWVGKKSREGYGVAFFNYKRPLAHRQSWIFYRGEIPVGKLVLHKCDVKPCVNPEHLYIGTQADNVRDALERGRYQSGSRSHSAVFNEELVFKMRQLRALGYGYSEIARKFNFNPKSVRVAIIGGWKSVQTVESMISSIRSTKARRRNLIEMGFTPTDKDRVNALIRWAKEAIRDPYSQHFLFAGHLKSRAAIDDAIRSELKLLCRASRRAKGG